MKAILIFLLLSASGYSLAQSACFSSFSDMTEFAPSRARSVDTADINNDGNLDIVIGSYFNTSPSLYYLEGNGMGGFEDPVLVDAVDQLIGVETGDFNDDGNMDIIAISRFLATAYLYSGNGDGTFNVPLTFSTHPTAFNSAPMGISSGDLNGDGSLDFAVTNINGTIKVYLSDASPNTANSFTVSDLASVGGDSRIEIDDFNSDTFLDLAVTNRVAGSVTVLNGNGSGAFPSSTTYNTGNGCAHLTTNDVDNDGDVDIVATNQLANTMSLLLNDGSGSFAASPNYTTSDKPMGVSVFDMNNDGNKDIQVVSSNDNVLNCFIADGMGDFTNSINNTLSNNPLVIATGDFNGDSEIDMGITAELGEVMIVLLGNLTGIHEIPNTHATNANATAMCNNDFDGDGNLDIIVANSVNNEFYLYTGIGNGDFNTPVTFTGVTNPVKCVSDDFNGDSNADVAFIEKSAGQVRVFLGDGSGGFTSNTAFPCAPQPIDLKLGEYNNDGNIDFFVLNDGSSQTILTGNGAGTFSAPITSGSFGTAISIEVGDLDRDGYDDIVTVNDAVGSNFAVFKNNSGSFGPPQMPILTVGSNPRNLVLVNLNTDTDTLLDVVTTNYNSDNLTVMFGNGLGAFNSPVTISSTDPEPLDIAAADFNNDGHQDVLVSYELGPGLTGLAHLYMGDGSGNLTLYKKFNLGIDPAEIQIGHFNNDTLMDAASLNIDSDNISILLNTTAQISTPDGVEFCNGQSVNLVSNTDISNEWSNAETTQTISATASGSYTVTTTQSPTGYCYSTSPEVTVSFLPPPAAPTITSASTTACHGSTIELTSSAATGNVWSTGETTQSIFVSTSGTYSVVQDVAGCLSDTSNEIVVEINPPPVITAMGPTSFCMGDNVTLSSDVATGITWSTTDTDQDIVVSNAGNYSVTLDVPGCPSLTSNVITTAILSTPPQPTITASGPTTFCQGDSVILTSSSATGNEWSTTETDQQIVVHNSDNITVQVSNGTCTSPASEATVVTVNSIPSQPTITADGSTTFCSGDSLLLISSGTTNNVWSTTETNDSIYVFTSGTYKLHTSNNGCNSDTSDIVITVNASPSAPTISASGPTEFCIGESVDLTSSSPTGNVWSTSETDQTITVNSSNNYSVHVIDMGCSSDTVFMNVTVNSIPTQPTITADGSTTFCSGDSLLLISSETMNNVWSTTETNDSIYVFNAGTYKLHTSNNGCNSDTSELIVATNPSPLTPIILEGTSASFCEGETLSLNSNSAVDNVWSTTANTQSIDVTVPGTYTLTLVNGFGCESPSAASIVVSEIPLPPAPTITAGGPTTICTGGSVELTSSSPNNNVWSTSESGTSIIVSASGTYWVQYTNANGCYSPPSDDIIVTVIASPAPPVITASGPTSFCPGGSVDLSTDYTSGIQWSNAMTGQTITVSSSETLTAIFNDGNGCQSLPSNDVTVTVHPDPATPVITPSGPVEFCVGGSVDLTTSINTGVLWSTTETDETITVTASDVITVSHTDGNGCQATSAPLTVSVDVQPASPVISAVGDVEICEGDSVMIESNSPNTYWSTSVSGNSIYVGEPISVTAVALNGGCPSPSSNVISVIVNPAPLPANIIVDGSLSFCEGDSVKLISGAVSNFEWSNQSTDQILVVDTSGLFSISTTNQFDCVTHSDTVEVIAHPYPTLTVNDYPVIMCPNWNATLLNTATPVGGIYTGESVDGDGYFNPAVGAGVYQFSYTYTSPAGCTSVDSAYVTVDGCLGIDEHDLTEIKLYPNPTMGEFTVDAGDFNVKSIMIQNVQGQLIRTFEMNGVSVFTDYLDLPNGVYYVNIETEENDTALILPLTIVN